MGCSTSETPSSTSPSPNALGAGPLSSWKGESGSAAISPQSTLMGSITLAAAATLSSAATTSAAPSTSLPSGSARRGGEGADVVALDTGDDPAAAAAAAELVSSRSLLPVRMLEEVAVTEEAKDIYDDHEDLGQVLAATTSYWKCLSMSFLAGISTTLGAAVVLLMPGNRVPPPQMAFILALAGGVMLSASLLEFWLPAFLDGGFKKLGNIVFFSGLGVAAFLAFSSLVPEPDFGADKVSPRPGSSRPNDCEEEGDDLVISGSSARAATFGKGSIDMAATFEDEENPMPPSAAEDAEAAGLADAVARQWRLAMVLMLSLTAHNFPEGMAVAVSAMDSERLGIVVMIAIAIHNIPEGVAISVPVLAATGSRRQAVLMTFLSGIAEPFGALVTLCLAGLRGAPSEQSMENLLCCVGGIMSAVSLKELLPESWRTREPVHAIAGFLTGFVIMLVTKHFGA